MGNVPLKVREKSLNFFPNNVMNPANCDQNLIFPHDSPL